ncbi:hypothetical protein ACFE04_019920 [Oxalis oulophora]
MKLKRRSFWSVKNLLKLFRCNDNDEEDYLQNVKKGCFPVIVKKKGCEPKRFLVPLSCLEHPPFVKLLDEAHQEFDYSQKGVLVIPCDAARLQTIIYRYK